MNEQTKKDILTWAQEQLGLWTSAHEDWWGAYNDEWDINIYDADLFSHEEQYRGKMCVTAYRMFTDEEGFLTTDMADFVRLGACERPGHLVWPETAEGNGFSYDGDKWSHCDRPAWSDDEGVTCSKCQQSFAWDEDDVTA